MSPPPCASRRRDRSCLPDGRHAIQGSGYGRTVAVLRTPIRIGTATVRNRLYRAPVLEGAGSGPDAADAYAKQFVANARAGVGLIIVGSACILEEGRTSPG